MSFLTTIPPELYTNFKEKRACFFVGAGLSISAGFPTWSGLIDELINQLEKRQPLSPEKKTDYQTLKNDPSKFLILAEDLKNEIGGTTFYDYLEDRFGKVDINPTEQHTLIGQISTCLTITTNYDKLIENGYNKVHGNQPNFYTYKQSREAANAFWKEKYFVLKAHGDANSDPQGIILSQRDYRKTLYRELGYRSLLQSIFTKYSIVFIGVSLNDPEFNQLLDFLHDSYHGGGPVHYALFEETKTNGTLTKRYLEEFKIQSIIFKNESKDYSDITDFLKSIINHLK